jgi:hypothetical protein
MGSFDNGREWSYRLNMFRSTLTNWRKLASKPWVAPEVNAHTRAFGEDSKLFERHLEPLRLQTDRYGEVDQR